MAGGPDTDDNGNPWPSPPCQPLACQIQACIVANEYDASKCTKQVAAFEKCCRAALRERNGAAGEACMTTWKRWKRAGDAETVAASKQGLF
ncbi:hypothetical protein CAUPRSCDRAFT_6956 [Caulochytrium protostelioides]|uniref:Cx9C motif-containing protein 4, mitochondrial n=1 Tax=Caulochytrium protostelioides TaxID=1555241 RepID=A0A4P9WXB2_9FUNG|nr:hypothetical protein CAUPRSCDRAFT_6956 [Caulochytrium protostelioides]